MTSEPELPEQRRHASSEVAFDAPPESTETKSVAAEAIHTPERAKEQESMLDVHPAHHAASSWREFFIHIATIVLGLIIAVGLEQSVEYFHHRHQIAELRDELRQEREANRKLFQNEAVHWRWEAVELQNNLMVLSYLQKHPGTPDEKLPGVLLWGHRSELPTEAAWNSAKTSGVTSLMPRDEVEQYETFYIMLRRVDEARQQASDAMWDASRYQFVDGRLADLTPKQIDEILALTEIAMNKHWSEGVALSNNAQRYKDFPHAPAELDHLRSYNNSEETVQSQAFAATMSRMKASGYPR